MDEDLSKMGMEEIRARMDIEKQGINKLLGFFLAFGIAYFTVLNSSQQYTLIVKVVSILVVLGLFGLGINNLLSKSQENIIEYAKELDKRVK